VIKNIFIKIFRVYRKVLPGKLNSYFDKECFVYAVPYTIKSYQDILKNQRILLNINHDWEHKIIKQRAKTGVDGALIRNSDEIYHVNFIERYWQQFWQRCQTYS
jgi:hypothetical protein